MKTLLMTSSLMLGICACGATLKPMMKSNWNNGIRLEDDGGPVSIGSLLTFAKPDWTDRYVRSRPEGYNGVITDAKVVHKVDPRLEEEALYAIRNMPKWIPAKMKGKAISSRYTIPVRFTLKEMRNH